MATKIGADAALAVARAYEEPRHAVDGLPAVAEVAPGGGEAAPRAPRQPRAPIPACEYHTPYSMKIRNKIRIHDKQVATLRFELGRCSG